MAKQVLDNGSTFGVQRGKINSNFTENYDSLALKQDKVTGKGLSTEDFTTASKNSLADVIERSFYQGQYLPDLKYKLANTPSTTKMVFVGDSTADIEGNASSLPTEVKKYTYKGDLIAGFDVDNNMPNFGANGNTLEGFLNNTPSGKGIDTLITYAPDGVIFTYGINSVRQNVYGYGDAAVLAYRNKLIEAVNKILKGVPSVNIVLRMPNSFLSAGSLIDQGTYTSIAEAAQAQSDIIYKAWKGLENYWDKRVQLWNSQDEIFGRTSNPTNTGIMGDQIHPSNPSGYAYVVSGVINLTAPRVPFIKSKSIQALNASYATPWTVYNRALEDTEKFILVWEGRYIGQGTTYIDANGDSYRGAGDIFPGDIINMANDVIFKIGNVSVAPNSGSEISTRITLAGTQIPSNTVTGGFVRVYRSIYNHTKATEIFLKDKRFTYVRRVRLTTCGSGFIRINTVVDDDILTQKIAGLVPARFQLQNSDYIIADGEAPLQLTSATAFNQQSTTTLEILIAGDYTTYTSKVAYIFGIHAYENPNTELNNARVLPVKSNLAQGKGTLAMAGTTTTNAGGLLVEEIIGRKYIEGTLYKDGSVPAGNIFSNSITKNYFSTFPNLPIGCYINGLIIKMVGYGTLSTDAATAGTLTMGVDSVQTIAGNTLSLGTGAAYTLPLGLVDLAFRFELIALVTTTGTSGQFESQGFIELGNGVRIPLSNTTKRTVNMNVANDLKFFSQFSVASASNVITLRLISVNVSG